MDSQFCGDCKFTCLISLTETIIFMALFLYQYKVMSTAWAELKPKEPQHKSFTLRKKIAFIILLIITLILELILNNYKPYMIFITIGSQIIVYLSMIKILFEDNKYFNQSRKQFRRFIKYPFIFSLLQTFHFIFIGANTWINFIQILLLFYFYEYLVDKSCNLQVKDLKKHIKKCENQCIANTNLNYQINNKQFLDETPNLQVGLLPSNTYHRNTPEFDNMGSDFENEDSENSVTPIKISFGRDSTLKQIYIKETQQDIFEIKYEQNGQQKIQIMQRNVLNDFMRILNIENNDFSQIWNDDNYLIYFNQYLEANNKQKWCDNFQRQELIVTFSKKSQ